jgi:hypothetical protein
MDNYVTSPELSKKVFEKEARKEFANREYGGVL